MGRYAVNTSVSVEKSKAEIEGLVRRYGAEKFISGWDREQAVIGFFYRNRHIKITLELPDRGDFVQTPGGRKQRGQEAILKAWEQACRQSWRALALVIKAKFEAVESGIATFEDEFLAYTMLPDGQTVGQFVLPQIETMILAGTMPKLLLPGVSKK
ncbi:MAG TPA: hypothetical protein VMW16_11280 [Sedimentisphaerales bacterium]|nr:hypothetical protein [Sedimentisphaerales bacterium]